MKNIFLIGRITEQGTRKYFDINRGFSETWIDNATECETSFSSRFDAQSELSDLINYEKGFLFIEEFFTK